MKPVKQTIGAPPNGNCFAACVASILEVPLTGVINPRGEDYQDKWRQWFAKKGLTWVEVDVEALRIGRGGYTHFIVHKDHHWIAAVPSLNYTNDDGSHKWHSVVMKGDELAHDPSTESIYESVSLDDVRDASFLFVDPARAIHKLDTIAAGGVPINRVGFGNFGDRSIGGMPPVGPGHPDFPESPGPMKA